MFVGPGQDHLHDFCLRHGFRWIGGVRSRTPDDGSWVLSLHRRADQDPFGPAPAARMAILTPHIQRAAHLGDRFAQIGHQNLLAHALIDRLAVAVCLVDDEARIMHANPAAELRFGAGRAVVLRQGRLFAGDVGSTNRIRQACRAACGPGSRGSAFRVVDARTGDTVQFQVLPVGPSRALAQEHPRPVAVVLLGSMQEGGPAVEYLQSMFGLTPAEARLAGALAAGSVLDSIRLATGVSINTLRKQLASIFGKMGVETQAQLVTTVKALPAGNNEN